MRLLQQCRDDWHEHQAREMERADRDCRGTLIAASRRAEFGRRYGFTEGAMRRGLFQQAAMQRMLWASPELKEWWRSNGHVTFEQWAWDSGFRHQFITQARRRRSFA